MGVVSTYGSESLLGHTFLGDTFTAPGSHFAGWFVTPPGPTGGVEAEGAREAVTFDPASGGTITSDAAVSWSSLHTEDQMVAGLGIWDAATDGNLLAVIRTRSRLIRANAPVSIPAGGIEVSIDLDHVTVTLANAWLDHLLRGTTYTPPTFWWFGQYTETPTSSDPGTEVTGGGYERRVSDWVIGEDRNVVLDNDPSWDPLHTDTEQTLTGWALSDEDEAGDVGIFAAYTEPLVVPADTPNGFPVASVSLRLI
jgi:hypothetical protein